MVGIRSGERENTTMIEALLLAVAGGMFSYAAWLTLHYLKSISKDIAASARCSLRTAANGRWQSHNPQATARDEAGDRLHQGDLARQPAFDHPQHRTTVCRRGYRPTGLQHRNGASELAHHRARADSCSRSAVALICRHSHHSALDNTQLRRCSQFTLQRLVKLRG